VEGSDRTDPAARGWLGRARHYRSSEDMLWVRAAGRWRMDQVVVELVVVVVGEER
jgi:hypothetical protein